MDGAIRIRLPGPPASYRVRVRVEWDPAEVDEAAQRAEIFRQVRSSGDAFARALLDKMGEDAIRNRRVLLFAGSTADDPIERPEQPPLETRDPLL